MFITLNAQILNFAVVTSGIGQGLAQGLAGLGLSPLVFFCLLFLIYLVVGMFIDGLSIMLLTVPLLYPSFIAMGFDRVWVGVIIVIFIELGALTPPMGLNLFAIQSIANDRSLARCRDGVHAVHADDLRIRLPAVCVPRHRAVAACHDESG